MSVRTPIRRWLSVKKDAVVLFSEYLKDFRRYRSAATPSDRHAGPSLRGTQLECQITKDYHRVEKGLSLSNPKRPFGSEVARRLDLLVPIAAADPDSAYVGYARDAQRALASWNAGEGVDDIVSPLKPGEISPVDPELLTHLFESRHSIRNFSAERPVDVELLRQATGLALSTPSVCNRQAWRVHYFHGDDVPSVLKYQNGNSGFTKSVPCVAVVTVDSRLFAGPEERNQVWIEGGLFSMSLVLALHGLGLGTCMLNMSVRNHKADSLRAAFSIPEHENVIMMIAIGYPGSDLRVARSPRRALGDVHVDSAHA